MLIPELPAYLTSLGGEDYKGLIISLFTLTAGLSRPISGKLADRIGRIPVMALGLWVCMLAGFLYPVLATVIGFFLMRFLHGFSTGFTPTGTSAYLADIVPFERRGEAMGWIGLANSSGMAAGPALGGWLISYVGIDTLFYISSFLALLAWVVLISLPETVTHREKLNASLLWIKRHEILEPAVLKPAWVMVLVCFPYGLVLTIVPDYSVYFEVSNKGTFFAITTVASTSIRLFAGRFSDIYGRVPVMLGASLLLAFSMFWIALSNSSEAFLWGAVWYGLAAGMGSPTLFAWAIDLSDERFRGRGMATLFIAMELGIGLGAFISGSLYANDNTRVPMLFGVSGLMCLVAVSYLVVLLLQKKKNL